VREENLWAVLIAHSPVLRQEIQQLLDKCHNDGSINGRYSEYSDYAKIDRNIEIFKKYVGWNDGVAVTEMELSRLFNLSYESIRQILRLWHYCLMEALA
jgi:DNA-directed RNA polymerase sigma subunit (sigma70/sigma32)